MLNGPAKWNAVRSFYDGLTLREGDDIEQCANSQYGLGDTVLPWYTRFWKYHVCPATVRPHGIALRTTTANIIAVVAQRSHAILGDLLNAFTDLQLIRGGDLGRFERNAENVLTASGNALQKAYDFKSAISAANPKDFQGMLTLAATLGKPLDPFSDWDGTWSDDRTQTAKYRHYLTHQGKMYKVRRDGKVYVPSRDRFQARKAYSWQQFDQDYTADPTGWVEIVRACEEVITDSVAFLDLVYERLCNHLNRFLFDRNYQELWGWQDGDDPLNPQPRPGRLVPGPTVSGTSFLGVWPNDGPGASGER